MSRLLSLRGAYWAAERAPDGESGGLGCTHRPLAPPMTLGKSPSSPNCFRISKAGWLVLSASAWAKVADGQGIRFPSLLPFQRSWRQGLFGGVGEPWGSLSLPAHLRPASCPPLPSPPSLPPASLFLLPPPLPHAPPPLLPPAFHPTPSFILLFLPSWPPPFPLLLPCPRGRARRVVKVN